MTQVIIQPWDEFLFKLIELTSCDIVDWGEEPWACGGYRVCNQEIRCKADKFLWWYTFNFEGWERWSLRWNKEDPITILFKAVEEQQGRKEEAWRVKKKEAIMELKCEDKEDG